MKILFVLELFYPNIGGIERLFLSLGEALVKDGNEVNVITTKFREDLPTEEEINGIKIKRLALRNRFAFTFFSAIEVTRQARKSDIIHTTSYNAAFPAWIASKLTGTRAIITFHEVWGKLWFNLPYLSFIERLLFYTYEKIILLLGFDKFVGVSEHTRSCLVNSGIPEKKAIRIYNGLKEEEYDQQKWQHDENRETFIYTYFGRLGYSKGLDLLMEASGSFLRKGNRKLRIISSENPKRIHRKIRSWIRKNDIQDRVSLFHHLPEKELLKQLYNSDCVVIPSYSEGFCFAAVECVARGIPVISSGKAALKEVMSGKFIEMDDFSSSGLSSALIKAESAEFEEKPVRKFLLNETLKEYISLYKFNMKPNKD